MGVWNRYSYAFSWRLACDDCSPCVFFCSDSATLDAAAAAAAACGAAFVVAGQWAFVRPGGETVEKRLRNGDETVTK